MRTKNHRIFLIAATVVAISSSFGYAQELITPNFQFQYFKNTENTRYLKATLTYTEKRIDKPLSNFAVNFIIGPKKEHVSTIMTDSKGVADLQLSDDFKVPETKNGTWIFSAEFLGNDSIEAVNSEIEIKDLILDMSLDLVDSVKTISLKASTINNGKIEPIIDEPINVFVTRMFSLLQIGDGTFDSEGNVSIEFPTDIPGDKQGNITVIAKIDEHPTYGNVEKRVTCQWGVPSTYQEPTTHRALWTKGAPTWMVVALTIMLLGVWGHYFYAIICLVRIKLLSKKEKESSE